MEDGDNGAWKIVGVFNGEALTPFVDDGGEDGNQPKL